MFKIQYSNTSKELLKNYGLISVLKHFSNILERVMYNRLYSCLDQITFYIINSVDLEVVIQAIIH